MSAERWEILLGQLFDGELSPEDADELAALLRCDAALRRELRQHLVLWELWSQEQAPERSAEAFLAGWRTRLRAERQGESFLAVLKKRIVREAAGASRPARLAEWWRAVRRPAALGWAASLALVVCAAFFWLMVPQRAEAAVTIRGEAVCPACVLHTGHAHVPAVRVQEKGETQVYYLEATPQLGKMQGYFCSGPNSITVEGKPHSAGGRTVLNVSRIELPPAPAKPSEDQRSLFPF